MKAGDPLGPEVHSVNYTSLHFVKGFGTLAITSPADPTTATGAGPDQQAESGLTCRTSRTLHPLVLAGGSLRTAWRGAVL